MLKVRDLRLDYGGVVALHGVDLDVEDGELASSSDRRLGDVQGL
jgi:ABC-type branched-subunit amino acid transport system ATPase component